MPNIINIASALSLTATGPTAGVRLGVTPLLGGRGREGKLFLSNAIGGAGVVAIQGHPSTDKTAPASGDAGWATISSLTSASPLLSEIADLPNWIRLNVTTAGTGTLTATLEGVQ